MALFGLDLLALFSNSGPREMAKCRSLHRLTVSSERGYDSLLNLARVQMLVRFRLSSRSLSRAYAARVFHITF